MKEKKPIGGRIFTIPFLICLGIALIALYFLAKRFIFGLGAVTNMNDGYPWGIWIAYDVVVGTAFGCGERTEVSTVGCTLPNGVQQRVSGHWLQSTA